MQLLYLTLIFLSLISLCGAAVYRLYSLNTAGIIISIILSFAFFIIIQRFKDGGKRKTQYGAGSQAEEKKENKNFFNYLIVVYCLLAAACFFILFKNSTASAIISPWQAVPAYYFVLYAAASGAIFYLAAQASGSRRGNVVIFLISLHYFLSFSAACIIYKIGYGFDPFIHQATIDLISKTGAVAPKPFYYLGQYSLIVIIYKITGLSLVWLDKLLVPVLATIFLPFLSLKIFSKLFENNKIALQAVLVLLAIPFPYLIVTMPQNSAYLFLIFALLSGLTCSNSYDLILVFLFAFTSLLIHPLAGIPALLFACALAVYCSNSEKIKKYLYALIFFVSAAILPLAFYLLEKTRLGGINALNGLNFSPPKITIPGQENFILNFVYLYGLNIKLIISLLALAGIFIFWRHRKECKIFGIYLLMASSLSASYVISKILPFNFLIDYERDNYSARILLVAAFFLIPFIISTIYFFLGCIARQPKQIALPIYAFIILLITSSLYLSYPRFDNYFNSRGYSTSENDVNAVKWINKNGSDDFIVLADQQVSAAALREFGFKKYYKSKSDKSEIFYYPIPTGGPLYQYYLNMVYKKPNRETMNKAMNLAGVQKSYFVLNDYWRAFPKLIEEAKLDADGWKSIDEGKIYIFKYER